MDRLRRALGLAPWNTFAPYLLVSLIVTGLIALAVVGALVAGASPGFVWTVGLTLLIPALLIVGVTLVAARREAGQISELLTGEIWARWRYDSAENERLAAIEWDRAETMVRQTVGSAFLVGTVILGACALSDLDLGLSIAISSGLAGVLLLVAAAMFFRGRSRYQRRLARPVEVIFGPRTMLRDGAIITLWGSKAHLKEIDVKPPSDDAADPAPSRLVLVRRVERTTSPSHDWDIFTRRYWTTTETEIDIPAGREEDASTLVEHYRRLHTLDSVRRTAGKGHGEPEHAGGFATRLS